MSVFKRSDAATYRYGFIIKGRRFSGSTKCTSKREAEAVERVARKEAEALMEAGGVTKGAPMTLDEACGRYWDEVGQFSADAGQVERSCLWLTANLPPAKPIRDIDNSDVARLVATRRLEPVENAMRARKRAKGFQVGAAKRIAPATVNRSVTQPLRRILKRAAEVWGEQVKAIRWRDHMLGEPAERVRHMSGAEEALVVAELPDCYRRIVAFAVMSGCRASECVRLKWSDVEWGERRVQIVGKGHRGNAKLRTVPISADMRELLWSMRGNAMPGAAVFRNASEEPVTYRAYYAAFRTACRRAGVKGLRVHDLRHTAATRILRKTGNIKIAQKLLGHSDIATTARYAHVVDADIREAMDAVAQDSHRSATPGEAKPLQMNENR